MVNAQNVLAAVGTGMIVELWPPELVIFDCDGVLVDSERISNEVLAEVLGEHGVQLSWEEAKAIFLGQSVEDARTDAVSILGLRCC